MKTLLFFLGAFLLGVTSFAQQDPAITVYWDDHYHGASQQITGDWEASQEWNDQISSIRIPQGYKIQVFEHGNQGGRSMVLTSDWTITPANGDFNDFISSIKILEYPQHHRMHAGGGDSRDRVCCDKMITKIESPNHLFFVVFQDDKNLVVYTADSKPLWASNTGGLAATHCVMQMDGNLVIYNGQTPIWASNTNGNERASLRMQNDGNLVIYSDGDKRPLWQSNTVQASVPVVEVTDRVCCGQTMGKITSPNGQYFAVFQDDKNLVLYNAASVPLWASNTGGLPATTCVMQADGNLVIYNGKTPIWSSNTYGSTNASLRVQDDGNMVIYTVNGEAKWNSNTVQQVVTTPVVVVTAPIAVTATAVVSSGSCAMPDASFSGAKKAIDAQAFRDAKMSMAKQAIKGKCLSIDQIRELAKLFSFEDQSLEFVKYAYDFTDNHGDYYTLADVFSFNSSVESLTKFLDGK